MLRFWCACALYLYLLVGTGVVVVRAQYGSRVAVEQARREQIQLGRLDALENEMQNLRVLRIAERLAVLDEMKDRASRLETMMYSLIGTTIVNGLLLILQLRSNAKPR